MLFHLLAEHINIFRYLTFRSMAAGISAFVFVVFFGPWMIQTLQQMKFGQQVRNEGPEAHLCKTGTPTMGGLLMWFSVVVSSLLWANLNGFILIVLLSVLLFLAIGFVDDYAKIKQSNTKGLSPAGKLFFQIMAATLVLFLTSLIPQYHQTTNQLTLQVINNDTNELLATTNVSILDEWEWKLQATNNTETKKFIIQYRDPDTGKTQKTNYFTVPIVLNDKEIQQGFSSRILKEDQYSVTVELTRTEFDIDGVEERSESITTQWNYKARLFRAFFVPIYTNVVWYWSLVLAFLFYIFIIVGVSNATNLSDGLDGLAVGMGVGFYLPFGIFAYLIGNAVLSSYLIYPYIEGVGELAIFVSSAIGAFCGFLWYNVHPAQIFMGDTGSLPMGASIALIAIMLKQELLLVVAGFMFVLETVSVILQVFWFKKFKKRIFKMAPIHHHFELSGWHENQVVVRFWIMSAFCALLALATIKIR